MGKLGLVAFTLGIVGSIGVAGCGGSTTVTGAVTYPLPGASSIDLLPGDCIIVNAAPQSLPASTVSYSLTDLYADNLEVGVVPSSYTCQFSTYSTFIDDTFSGSASDSGGVPAGTYDLDVICENLISDCLIDTVTWSATY